MDSKRLIIAIVISCLVFIGWNFLSVQMGWIPEPPAQTNATDASVAARTVPDATDPSAPAAPLVQPDAVIPPAVLEGRPLVVQTPLYKAVFNTHGGLLQEFDLLQYKKSIDDDANFMNLVSKTSLSAAPMGLYVNGIPSWAEGQWRVEGGDLALGDGETGSVRFIGNVNGMIVTRELTFSGSGYTIDEKTAISAPERKNISFAYTFGASSLALLDSPSITQRLWHAVFGGPPPVAGESQHNVTRVAWLQKGSFDEEHSTSSLGGDKGEGTSIGADVSWVGVMNNYFIGAVTMADQTAIARANYENGVYRVMIGRSSVTAAPDMPAIMECSYYLGPKETRALSQAPGNLDKALDYGWFTILAKPLVYLLQFFHNFVGNYGVAIILMTLVVKLVLWPLSLKGYRSMEQMRKIQPLMQEVREKYAGDKEKMNQEMMALYKRHKVNPAGGCLPILLQIPVFFALYRVLLNSIELRHASFIEYLPFTDKPWLVDLAAQDPYLITPLIMGATMFIQQKLTPAPGDPTQAKIMLFMPVIFTVLFITFPAGLVLYWLTNNVISIGQQWWQMRRSKSA